MVNTGFAVLGAGLRVFLEGLAEASVFQGSRLLLELIIPHVGCLAGRLAE